MLLATDFSGRFSFKLGKWWTKIYHSIPKAGAPLSASRSNYPLPFLFYRKPCFTSVSSPEKSLTCKITIVLLCQIILMT